MSQFKNQADVWHALLNGKKVTHRLLDAAYICLLNGFLVDNDGQKRDPINKIWHPCLYSPQDWSIYNEPKPKKILKPFLLKFSCSSVGINFCENEEQAKEYCKRHGNDFIGPAKGIPDQEIAE